MTAQGEFGVEHERGVPVVQVSGEVDLTNAHELEAALDRAARAEYGAVVVSLVQAVYFDSKGVRALLRAADRLATMRQRLLVVAPSGSVLRRILEIAGAPEALPTFDSLEEALASATGEA
ncbi:MAG: STAS domain-containing protein [Armatimonadota bacterium]|nr:STAS domain-containing protein [Armatimonadota bacterium]MDR7448026.1 STAS domain-containing protein [Armatimonadota bacterium]MDR7459719.1 STAS domain-containing protein [Armatimonadota bacterium]MDR7478621.1 STAS domain-containing protein [Armatimonadota bacterium]MDR7488401.1 STAS domain-containing protein [Armatimonadota bacterium]